MPPKPPTKKYVSEQNYEEMLHSLYQLVKSGKFSFQVKDMIDCCRKVFTKTFVCCNLPSWRLEIPDLVKNAKNNGID